MKTFKALSLVAVVAVLTSCSSIKVVADVDQTVDFSKYKTYSFLGWQQDSDQILAQLVVCSLPAPFCTRSNSTCISRLSVIHYVSSFAFFGMPLTQDQLWSG